MVNLTFKPVVAALVLAGGFSASAVAGPLEDGLDAARGAGYAAVIRLWRPLAEQGDARAQFNLALMYDTGRGVPQDYGAAVIWYRKAAEQGDAEASTQSRAHVRQRRGVPKDSVSAQMW